MAKIIQNHEGCIGCGTCEALCPKFWKMDHEEGKANLIGARIDAKTKEQTLKVDDIGCNQDAADCCPVQVIHII